MGRRRWLSAAIGLIAVGACPDPGRAEGVARVVVDAVRLEEIRREVRLLGHVVARFRGEVAARVAGLVRQVPVQVGSRVEAGELLVRLDPERFEQAVARAATAVEVARAERDTARFELERLELALARLARLRNSAAFPRARYEDLTKQVEGARASLAAAEARLEQARVALQQSRLDLRDAEIRAPYAGVVLRTQVSPGRYVRIGDPVVTLVDSRDLEVEVELPADLAAAAAPGMEATIRIRGASSRGRLRTVLPVEDPLTRTRAARLTFAEGLPVEPAVGETVEVTLPLGDGSKMPTLDKDAVLIGNGKPRVYVLRDGIAELREVVLGPEVGRRFVVERGLEPGDLVVVRGNERLRPGQRVEYRRRAPAAAGGRAP